MRYLFWKNDLAAADALMRSAPASAQPLLASLKARYFLASGREPEARRRVDELLSRDDQDVDALMLKARFAVQDKVWTDGPDGEPWEIYTVLADAEMPAGQLREVEPGGDAMCCSSAPESAARCC